MDRTIACIGAVSKRCCDTGALCLKMALVPHASSSSQDGNKGAIVAIRGAEELTQEEYEKRIKDVRNTLMHCKLSYYCSLNQQALLQAEVLEEKLKFITEKIPTRIMNVAGSNAGAGSGEFHMYRQVSFTQSATRPFNIM